MLFEALIVGLVGSTVGLLLGFGLALGLKALFGAIGIDLSEAGLVFQWRTVIVAYAVGVLVTLLAAYLPARHGGEGAAGRRDARRRDDPGVVDASPAGRRRRADACSAPG